MKHNVFPDGGCLPGCAACEVQRHAPAEFQAAVQAERARQDARWGPPDAASRELMLELVAVLTEETGEVARAVLERDRENLREELIQVAAVAQKFWEALR